MAEHPVRTRLEVETERSSAFFPVMGRLRHRWQSSRPFDGLTIGVCAHLTPLTAALVHELLLAEGKVAACAASDATTDPEVVARLCEAGVALFDERGPRAVLDESPDLLADASGRLVETLVAGPSAASPPPRAAVEITRSGVIRIAALAVPLPLAVIDIDGGRLKPAVEKRHGVGEGLWQAVQALTGMHLAGRRVAVVGYGPVGPGVAAYARAAGAVVEVVEIDPIRRLAAHYDGHLLAELDAAVRQARVLVTCTGHPGVVRAADLAHGPRGLVLANAGHHGDEIDVASIEAAAVGRDRLAAHLVRYRLRGGGEVAVLGGGHPLNIVTNAGSPEPVLLHFTLLGLTLEWLTRVPLPPRLQVVPTHVEADAARLALSALGTSVG